MSAATPSDIIAAIESVIGDAKRPVALHEPLFVGNEKKYMDACIDEGWVSSAGEFVSLFERELAAYCGAKHAVVTINGTCALHAALSVMGVKPNDEVLLPSLTFIATANAIIHAGAVPHFVEVEEASLGIDPQALDVYLKRIAITKNDQTVNKETGRTIRAIVPVHVFGHPCQLAVLQDIADSYKLILIEDATEALGSQISNKPVGNSGTAVFSFNGNKIITTGGGGAITTDDATLAQRLKHLTSTAKLPHAWEFNHDAVAWNYRLPNINAALGCAQLEQIPKFLAAKRALAIGYIEAFRNISGIRILPEPEGTRSNYWLVTLLAEKENRDWLNATLKALHDAKLLCRSVWTPLHRLPMYKSNPKSDLTLTEHLADRIISLPSSPILGMYYA